MDQGEYGSITVRNRRQVIKVRKQYWMLWDDGYGARVPVVYVFGKPVLKKIVGRMVRNKLHRLRVNVGHL